MSIAKIAPKVRTVATMGRRLSNAHVVSLKGTFPAIQGQNISKFKHLKKNPFFQIFSIIIMKFKQPFRKAYAQYKI